MERTSGISKEVLLRFAPISLEETGSVRLMNRTDTKYIVSTKTLTEILLFAEKDYRVQLVDEARNITYHTVYLDTPKRDMFIAHQNGRKVREKIRIRTYTNSGLTFLEVKNKNNKGRTDKKRIRLGNLAESEKEEAEKFLQRHAWYKLPELSQQLENHFNRVTLVNKHMTERLTIDTEIRFRNLLTDSEASLAGLAIIELKRDGNTFSPIREVMRQLSVRPASISKYCIGSVLTDPGLKCNRFKLKLREITKVITQ